MSTAVSSPGSIDFSSKAGFVIMSRTSLSVDVLMASYRSWRGIDIAYRRQYSFQNKCPVKSSLKMVCSEIKWLLAAHDRQV